MMPIIIADDNDVSAGDDMAIAVGPNASSDRPVSIVITHVHNGTVTNPVVSLALTRERAQAVFDDLKATLDMLTQ